ncbi:transcriptional regulator with XRE-family HTH domain [Undibacterium sp. GrIS 1.8]|uniref:helix-turn-helix domain-containing protein n=1 Tax=Undibacterium sp. GrIS 1.8 TaxID=3143934 RepID=UPI003398C592
MDPALVFGQVLRRLRKEAGLTQEQLGFNAHVERKFISLIELGRNQPTVRIIFKLADVLGTTPSHMMLLVENSLRSESA